MLLNLTVCSVAKQDYQQKTQQLQEQISKLQQEVQKLKPLESQAQQPQQQQQQQQSTQQQMKRRESIDEEGASTMLKLPPSGSRASGRLLKKRVGFLVRIT